MKCHGCGKKLNEEDAIDEKGCKYMPADMKASNYAYIGRISVGHGLQAFYLTGSIPSPRYGNGKPPRPYCPSCFLKKLKRAVVALENALENKCIDPDDTPEAEQEPEEQPKKPEIVVPPAEEIKRDYPEWVARVTKAHHGVPLEGESLREIFRMQRRSGCV